MSNLISLHYLQWSKYKPYPLITQGKKKKKTWGTAYFLWFRNLRFSFLGNLAFYHNNMYELFSFYSNTNYHYCSVYMPIKFQCHIKRSKVKCDNVIQDLFYQFHLRQIYLNRNYSKTNDNIFITFIDIYLNNRVMTTILLNFIQIWRTQFIFRDG